MIKKGIISCLLSVTMICTLFPQLVFAEREDPAIETERVVLLYVCGSDLESVFGCATYNIMQILTSDFSQSEKVKCIIMTGGSSYWDMDNDCLYDPETGDSPEGGISSEYNQIWEAKGVDDKDNPQKLVLLDRDGVIGDGEEAVPSEDELMSDPETLRAFVNYVVDNYPANRYDLVLWDHGGGPLWGYGNDEHRLFGDDGEELSMSYAKFVDAVADNHLVNSGRRFNLIDFDACLMGNAELVLAIQDYTDYYIASAETEPGDGQDYRGWFNAIGKEPAMDTFELGKIIVDDYIDYYNESDEWGDSQDGTLAVIDMNELKKSGFTQALISMNDMLEKQIREGDGNELLYYDEIGAVENSIRYSTNAEPYRDLGNIASQLCIALKEPKKHVGEDGTYSRFNDYGIASQKLCDILGNEKIIYARGTAGITASMSAHIDKSGEILYEDLITSGLYLFFPTISSAAESVQYVNEIDMMIEGGHINNEDTMTFLSSYRDTVLDYALLTETGSAVMNLVDHGVSKDEINYEKVREYWNTYLVLDEVNFFEGVMTRIPIWDKYIHLMIDQAGGEENVKPFLETLIRQQAEDAVSADNVSASIIEKKDGNGYRIRIDNTDKRVVDSVDLNIVAEFPAVIDYYIEKYGDDLTYIIRSLSDSKLPIKAVSGVQDLSSLKADIQTMSIEELLDTYNKWYEEDNSTWVFSESSDKILALKDADGGLHAAQVFFEQNGKAKVYVKYWKRDEDAENCNKYDDDQYCEKDGILIFDKQSDDKYVLSEFYPGVDEFSRPMSLADLKKDIKGVKTLFKFRSEILYYTVPITLNDFTISAENEGKDISLVPVKIDELEDIADVDVYTDGKGDGEKVHEQYVVRDMYNHETDISNVVKEANGEVIYDISLVDVENVVFNGRDQGPVITFRGKVLKEGTDYEFIKDETLSECINPGTYEGTIIGKGGFFGSRKIEFDILERTSDETASECINPGTYGGTVSTKYNIATPDNLANGSVESSVNKAKKGEQVTITVTPEEGYQTASVAVKDAKGNNVEVIDNGDGTYIFTMPSSAVTVTPTFTEIQKPDKPGGPDDLGDTACPRDDTCPITPFKDTDKNEWYHDGVHWALEKAVMNGMSKTTFEPITSTARAMIVTMLWRMEGSPMVDGNITFKDVADNMWYTDAIRWAVTNGIVTGYDKDTFGTNDSVTREQLATILYRSVQAKGKGFTGTWYFPLNFDDADQVSEWADEAMHWMIMNGVIQGMSEKELSPKSDAVRAQVATMLMRFSETLQA